MFESPYIKISSYGIDLLNNYQVEKHLDFNEIEQINLIKGNIFRHWLVYLMSGFAILISCAVWGINSAISFELPQNIIEPYAYIAYHLFSPWILFIGGAIWTYQAFRKSPVLIISTRTNNFRIAIKEFEKNNSLDNLIKFLDRQLHFNNKYL